MVVVSFIVLLELLVIAFGYTAKAFYLFVWWWMNDFILGRLMAPTWIDDFLASTYWSLAHSSSFKHGWSFADIFVWWPNLGMPTPNHLKWIPTR